MSVTVRFCGAARTVTGSCHLFETPAGRLLVDCGMFQGPKTLKELNYGKFPFAPSDIDCVLLTHAHIDHSGLIPKLTRGGFRGAIWATRGTIDLCSYMLPDAGSIQESEVMMLNRRNAARGRPLVAPIYTQRDAIASLDAFRPVDYERWFEAMPGVRARYWNAGHLLGSASIEVEFAGAGKDGKPLRVLASGDLGPDAKLLEPDPEAPTGLDYIICESTYGDADRPPVTRESRRQHLAAEVRAAQERGGALLIPAFAVERTQELIVDLVDLMERGEIPAAPIFLDSPLAIRATEVFRQHTESLESDNIDRLLASPHLRCTETVEESKSIARLAGFHIIIAASGMCDAGRIRHHLKRWLWHAKATVLLVGFQAQGTLGRFLVDGAKAVRIMGEPVKVAARIRRLDEYSGHADGPELARWIASRRPILRGVFLVHGEEPAMTGLAERIAERTVPAAKVFTPLLDDIYELTTEAPTPIDAAHRRRLEPAAVVNLDWHNDMSKLILDINDAVEAAADNRARGVIIRRLRRALDAKE
jgi:metallo-beta-lactamase family protein